MARYILGFEKTKKKLRDIDPFKAPLHSVQLREMYFICRFANMSSCHASNVVRKSSTLYQVLDC